MPLFFFHVCDGVGFTEDEEGRELPDIEAARAEAIKGARSIMADDLQRGRLDLCAAIQIEDEQRRPVLTLSFAEAVALRPEAGTGEGG